MQAKKDDKQSKKMSTFSKFTALSINTGIFSKIIKIFFAPHPLVLNGFI
jgi:amino acid transporter